MKSSEKRRIGRKRRARGIRKKLRGTDARPRLCVFRSNRYVYAQVISDESGRTFAAGSSMKGEGADAGCSISAAAALGRTIAEQCKEQSIGALVFDRNGYKFHGRVKALADAVRESGLAF